MFARFSHATVLAGVITVAGTMSATAQSTHAEQGGVLFELLSLPDIIDIMRQEGLVYGHDIGQDMFPQQAGPRWDAIVAAIYDPGEMRADVETAFLDELEGGDLDAMIAFFRSDAGRTIVDLEVSARRALLDESVAAASKETAAIARLDETPRYLLVQKFIQTNDLVESNVVGTLNSNYAFYTGMLDGGGIPQDLTEDQILTDVWAQEPDIRNHTSEWIYSFLLMAYQPIDDADIESYIAFSETDAGQDLNNALFLAFDGMFEDISRGLGLASSQFLIGQDL